MRHHPTPLRSRAAPFVCRPLSQDLLLGDPSPAGPFGAAKCNEPLAWTLEYLGPWRHMPMPRKSHSVEPRSPASPSLAGPPAAQAAACRHRQVQITRLVGFSRATPACVLEARTCSSPGSHEDLQRLRGLALGSRPKSSKTSSSGQATRQQLQRRAIATPGFDGEARRTPRIVPHGIRTPCSPILQRCASIFTYRWGMTVHRNRLSVPIAERGQAR